MELFAYKNLDHRYYGLIFKQSGVFYYTEVKDIYCLNKVISTIHQIPEGLSGQEYCKQLNKQHSVLVR